MGNFSETTETTETTKMQSKMSYSRGRDLAELRGAAGWPSWRKKAKAYLLRKERAYVLDNARPDTLRHNVDTDATWQAAWIEQQREIHNAGQEELYYGDNESLREEYTPETPPLTRPETAEELKQRQATWDKDNERLWADLVECCVGEASSIVDEAPEGDGRSAYLALQKQYSSDSLNSKFLTIQALFRLKQNTPILKHVTLFKAYLRKLHELNIPLAEDLQQVIFLMTLKEQFKNFVTHAMMNGQSNINSLYKGAVEYAKVNLVGDEANTKGVAMQALATSNAVKCRYGAGCKQWRQGNCNRLHPPPKENQGKPSAGRGTKRQQPGNNDRTKGKGWNCPSCDYYNFETRNTCRECSAHKNKKKMSNTAYQARVEELEAQIETAKTRAEEMAIGGLFDEEEQPIEEFGQIAIISPPPERALATESEELSRFIVDSGATTHFVGKRVPLQREHSHKTTVEVAGGEKFSITQAGTCKGKTGEGKTMQFEAKRCDQFQHNLFSVYEAAKNGSRTVFDWDDSYIEDKSTGERVPIRRKPNGWELCINTSAANSAASANAL